MTLRDLWQDPASVLLRCRECNNVMVPTPNGYVTCKDGHAGLIGVDRKQLSLHVLYHSGEASLVGTASAPDGFGRGIEIWRLSGFPGRLWIKSGRAVAPTCMARVGGQVLARVGGHAFWFRPASEREAGAFLNQSPAQEA